MQPLQIDLPDNVFALLQCAPAQLEQEVKQAIATHWYHQGRISQEMAAAIAGLDRTDFLLSLAQQGKDSFLVDFDDLDRELARG